MACLAIVSDPETMLGAWFLCAVMHNFEDKKITWLLFGLIAASDGLRMASGAPGPAREVEPPLPDAPGHAATS